MTTKTIALTIALVVATGAVACSPGQVKVTNESPGADTPPGSNQSGSRNQNPVPGQDDGQVYFEHVDTQGTEIDQVLGVSYVSTGATTTTADGVALDYPLDFSPSTIFAADPSGAVYLDPQGLMSGSLDSLTLSTMASSSLYAFPGSITSLSISLAAKEVAWIDETGAVTVTDFASGTALPVALPKGETGATARLAPSGTSLLVLTADGTLLTFALSSAGSWTPQLSVPSIEVAAWSADGSRLAYVDTQAELTVDGAALTRLASADVHDLSWSGDTLLYWARLSATSSEIRGLDPASPAEQTLIAISVPATAGNGVVCPSSSGGALYYAEYSPLADPIPGLSTNPSSSAYLIKRATGANAVVIAEPLASDEGYLCPTTSAVTEGGK